MHPKYTETINQLKKWSHKESSIQGAIVLGSQVRGEYRGDEWSDLDVLLLTDTPADFTQSNEWLELFGETVCVIDEETPLDWVNLIWSVKRVLFTDNRALDFSILPYARVDDVFSMNAEIHAQGYEILYEANSGVLDAKIKTSLRNLRADPPQTPREEDLKSMINEVLFQLIFASKKIKRQELWVAVNMINQQVSNRLLQLLEFHSASTKQSSPQIRYDGRFLEQRLRPDVLAKLPLCFAKYDLADAVQTTSHLIDFTQYLAKDICEAHGYAYNQAQFDKTRQLHREIFGAQEHWA